jgi:hypothetical protein
MRTRNWLAGLGAGLLLAAPALAQTTRTFGGADPTQIRNVPVAVPDAPGVPSQSILGNFSLSSYLPRFSLFPGANLLHGRSSFPAAADMPGKNYLKSFQYRRAQPVSD